MFVKTINSAFIFSIWDSFRR